VARLRALGGPLVMVAERDEPRHCQRDECAEHQPRDESDRAPGCDRQREIDAHRAAFAQRRQQACATQTTSLCRGHSQVATRGARLISALIAFISCTVPLVVLPMGGQTLSSQRDSTAALISAAERSFGA